MINPEAAMKKLYPLILILFLLVTVSRAENYQLKGSQKSLIKYQLVQKIEPTPETVTVNLSFVEPSSFSSPTYNQEISGFKIVPGLAPDQSSESVDEHGNRIYKYSWEKPKQPFEVRLSFSARTSVEFKGLKAGGTFPVQKNDANVLRYLGSTDQVQANNAAIMAKALELTNGAGNQFDAVQRIITWIIDHMNYVLTPEKYDALYALNSGKGNCQNYSHLAAALLRAVNIPVRIVNGITLKKPYDVALGSGKLSLNMAEGRHSWIEVYFPEIGWMPFDPQQTEMFVSNRFLRIEIGMDNNDTENDGLVHWTRQKGSKSMLSFEEIYESDFTEDKVSITAEKLLFGPRGLLLLPPVAAGIGVKKELIPPKPVVPVVPQYDDFSQLKFVKAYEYGNLEFPIGINFAFTRESVDDSTGQGQKLQKTFLVETAEYVTGRQQFCQVFELEKPLMLQNISLALQKFGGTGEVWVELREDQNGEPGSVATVSQKVSLETMQFQQGYDWVDFSFADQGLGLSPDKYWISLAYSGVPVLNWFYSYGKPVGPVDGTRIKTKADNSWKTSVGFEFNYRISGLIP